MQKTKTKPEKNTLSRKVRFVEPMKATLVKNAPELGDWEYELKFDGYRALALKSGSEVRLLSRNQKDFGQRFPEIVTAVAALSSEQLILDGEIVALDAQGRSSFRLLQTLEQGGRRPSIAYYVFDLLRADGEEFFTTPLLARRERLSAVLKKCKDPLRFSAALAGQPQSLLAKACQRGLEGLIGKERNSLYEVGGRSRSWIKLKCAQEQEFVIGGFTSPAGTRSSFGALLVGVFENGKLRFAGKVGTGFTVASLKSLHQKMSALVKNECSFADVPKTQGHWVKPQLVCQVRFTEWTEDGKLRHPVFLGLRQDKAASEVIRERAA